MMSKKYHKLEEFVDKWSNLVPDLLVEIAIQLNIIEDFTAFRGVCTSWRAAVAKDRFKGLPLDKAPLLMLAENKYDYSDERVFYCLSTRKIHKEAVPEAKGKSCMDAGFGWIVAQELSTGEVNLFNPFYSSRIFQLPNSLNFPQFCISGQNPETVFLQKAILTADPSETSDFMVLVLVNGVLGFWKNGDANWTMIKHELPYPYTKFLNMGYCGGKMYAIYYDRSLWRWNPSANQMKFVLRLDVRLSQLSYMVESTAEDLLIIIRNKSRDNFKLARISAVERELEEIDDIGRDAIFLGENASVSVDADDFQGAVKPNCIYFTEDAYSRFHWDQRGRSDGKDMGIYDIGQGTIEWIPIESLPPLCPPF